MRGGGRSDHHRGQEDLRVRFDSMNRIVDRYQTMQSGAVRDETSEIARLWTQLETQRREMEALTRELAAERRQIEELRGSHMMGLPAVAETNHVPAALPLPSMLPNGMVPAMVRPVMPQSALPNMLLSQPHLLQPVSQPPVIQQPVAALCEDGGGATNETRTR